MMITVEDAKAVLARRWPVPFGHETAPSDPVRTRTPWEWANSTVFTLWAIGLSFVFLIAALISGFDIAFLGILIGVPFGFFTRKIWKINTSMPDFDQKDSYEGD